MRARLVDISRYQGQVNAQHLVDAGFIGIVARCTLGWSNADPFYVHNFRSAAEAGAIFGAYHVLWPANRDPTREARWFVENWSVDGSFPAFIVADLELMKGQSATEVARQIVILLREMQSRTGLRPIIYTGSWFWNGPTRLGPATPIGVEEDHPLWEAEYLQGRFTPAGSKTPGESPEPPKIPQELGKGWSGWSLWQWTSKGVPIGAPDASNMDYNVFNGTEEEFMTWLGLSHQITLEEKVDTLWEAHPELHPVEA